jgi:hypothetical protein
MWLWVKASYKKNEYTSTPEAEDNMCIALKHLDPAPTDAVSYSRGMESSTKGTYDCSLHGEELSLHNS